MRIPSVAGVLLLVAFVTGPLQSQLKFSEHSRLADSSYVEHQIKTISDEDVLSSLALDAPALKDVEKAGKRRDYVHAYDAWGSYWAAKAQPKYATQTYQLLTDTELLMGYDEVREYIAQHPEERDTVMARASLILRNVFRPWGDVVVDFGPTVDFNRDVGQSGKYGFHYWWWSKALIVAYVTTGDQRYLAKFDSLFHRWYEQRNAISRGFPELDVVYYELGLGVRNRWFIEYYFLPYAQRSTKTHERMLKTILGAARWLYELERWEGYRPGNWQIHGSYMLTQIALAFPEFKESRDWLKLGLQRLEEHLHQDFFTDGGHSERAPRNYTQATYLSYRNMYYLLSAYHVREDFAQEIRLRMGNTIDWWISMLAPTGEIPAINDSHRGLFPAFILQDGAEFYHKPYVYGVLRNLFGIPLKSGSLTLPPYLSRHMPASGFTVMRSDWTRDALSMTINYGKWSGFHTHNDLLDFEIYAYGKALAVDAGIGLTYDDPLYIPWYKSSPAHNMVTVNNQNMEREKIEGENIVWSSTASLDYFAGEHRGYAKLGVHHRREIVFVKPRYWIVLDALNCGHGGDTLSWYFHTPTALTRQGSGFRSIGAPGVLALPLAADGSARSGKSMAASTHDLTPGQTEEIDWFAFDQISTAGRSRHFNVLLFPFKDSLESVEYSVVRDGHSVVRGSGFTDDLYYSSTPFDDGEVSTDAAFLLIHHNERGTTGFSIAEGTYLRVRGREIWKSEVRSSADSTLIHWR
jgi:hypothetical protein